MCGVARRAWSRNENSIETCLEHNNRHKETDHITIPYLCDKKIIEKVIK